MGPVEPRLERCATRTDPPGDGLDTVGKQARDDVPGDTTGEAEEGTRGEEAHDNTPPAASARQTHPQTGKLSAKLQPPRKPSEPHPQNEVPEEEGGAEFDNAWQTGPYALHQPAGEGTASRLDWPCEHDGHRHKPSNIANRYPSAGTARGKT